MRRAEADDGPEPLTGRTIWIPQMSRGGAVAFASAFRSVGLDAQVCPDGDDRTLELGSRHTSGEECLPARVTLGNFLKVAEQPGFDPERAAFFMPTSDGPCRFGEYASYLRKVLADLGLGGVLVFSPNSRDGYAGIGNRANDLKRTAFRGLVCSDILRKMLHKTRPYELGKGNADAVHEQQIRAVAAVLERQNVSAARRMKRLIETMTAARDAFRKVPVCRMKRRPIIGVVGEIFCRLTPFTNGNLIERIEALGGECTLAHLLEWVWYTNQESQKRLIRRGLRFSMGMAVAKISDRIQRADEHRLYHPFESDFLGYEEPSTEELHRYAEPYLPAYGALGEMTLSVGKAVFFHHQGCDGVIDISPFTCMNGIVTEAVYPRVSADHHDIPIRNLFFDGTHKDVDRDLAIFLELAKSYRTRRVVTRPASGDQSPD